MGIERDALWLIRPGGNFNQSRKLSKFRGQSQLGGVREPRKIGRLLYGVFHRNPCQLRFAHYRTNPSMRILHIEHGVFFGLLHHLIEIKI